MDFLYLATSLRGMQPIARKSLPWILSQGHAHFFATSLTWCDLIQFVKTFQISRKKHIYPYVKSFLLKVRTYLTFHTFGGKHKQKAGPTPGWGCAHRPGTCVRVSFVTSFRIDFRTACSLPCVFRKWGKQEKCLDRFFFLFFWCNRIVVVWVERVGEVNST